MTPTTMTTAEAAVVLRRVDPATQLPRLKSTRRFLKKQGVPGKPVGRSYLWIRADVLALLPREAGAR